MSNSDSLYQFQLSGKNAENRDILYVVAKRTYNITSHGCFVAENQQPLVMELIYEDNNPNLLLDDIDFWPNKPLSDVVVKGHLYNHKSERVFHASISVGQYKKEVLAQGERFAGLDPMGHVKFSEPLSVDKIPLSYKLAYGGRDLVSEQKMGTPFVDELYKYLETGDLSLDEMKATAGLFTYPRNAAGTGYVLRKDKEAVEAAILPQIEHPQDVLTPHRLVAEDPWQWVKQPIPASLGWMDYGYFPRISWLGMIPDCDLPTDLSTLSEVKFGYASQDVFLEKPIDRAVHLRRMNGASLGLQLPLLKGNEVIALENLSPQTPDFKFQLPQDAPQIWVDGRKGTLKETVPQIQTIVIEPDESRMSIVWCGSALALRQYMAEELENMPFKVVW